MGSFNLPPGCGRLPSEDPIPPECENCELDECPGLDNCKIYLDAQKIRDIEYCECADQMYRDFKEINEGVS